MSTCRLGGYCSTGNAGAAAKGCSGTLGQVAAAKECRVALRQGRCRRFFGGGEGNFPFLKFFSSFNTRSRHRFRVDPGHESLHLSADIC